MKKLLIIALIIAFAACGANRNEETETPEISEILEILETERGGEPSPDVLVCTETYYVFESGFLDVKFRLPSIGWNFHTLDRASRNSALLWHSEWPTIDEVQIPIIFEISTSSEHPREWRGEFDTDSLYGGRWNWVHPAEEDEVFVTANGITVVQYSLIAPLWQWSDDSPIYATTMFIFRQDGRDYREVAGRSKLFIAMLYVPADLHEHFYTDARAALDGLEFLPDATISHDTTRTADDIGITGSSFPIIDGSTSTLPLLREIMDDMFVADVVEDEWGAWMQHRYQPWQASRTVPSYELLLAGEVDLILVPEPSAHVLGLVGQTGVALEFTAIATEALIFITSVDNPVSDITHEQILQIYVDNSITNWEEIGGDYGRIIPLSRNPHSGSQTLMDNLVLGGTDIHPMLARFDIGGMDDMVAAAGRTGGWGVYGEDGLPGDFALGYTVYFFLRQAWDREEEWEDGHWAGRTKPLSFNGIFPSAETILSGEYPLTTRYYAVLRASTPQDSPARKIADWLLTPLGQDAVERAGLGRLE